MICPTGSPPKYRSAILAAEIGAAMVYDRPLEPDFGAALEAYVTEVFQGAGSAGPGRA